MPPQTGSKSEEVYGGKSEISERHRHRYEVNNSLREQLAKFGMIFSGVSPDDRLVEMIELPDHPFFVACQFHPELKSRPDNAHPLFVGLVGAMIHQSENKVTTGEKPSTVDKSTLTSEHATPAAPGKRAQAVPQ